MKSNYQTAKRQPYNKETEEAYLIKIFRIKEQVRYAKNIAKIGGGNQKQEQPTA